MSVQKDKEGFFNRIDSLVKSFKKIGKKEIVRVISHVDCDGLCACAIIVNVLNNENLQYTISIYPNLRDTVIRSLAKEPNKYYIFTDFGASQIDYINKDLKDKEVFILDHHYPHGKPLKKFNYLSPYDYGFNGNSEVCGAGLAFFFAHAVDKKNKKLAHLGIIGAVGDVQESKGFKGLNKEILKIGVENSIIQVKDGLKFFGLKSRPIHKLIAYSTELFIPGASNSESGAVQFLRSININPKSGGRWRMIGDLDEDEKKRLIAGIIMSRASEENPEDIFSNVYVLPKEEGLFSDAREFSTVLNACGRLNKSSIGIGACLGDRKMQAKAMNVLGDYKRELLDALNWVEKEKKKKTSKRVILGKNYMIINAHDHIIPTVIGTVASIISKSNNKDSVQFILSMAHNLDGSTKISLRSSVRESNLDLRALILEMIKDLGGEAGGHTNAAGAVIKTSQEPVFIERAKQVLEMAGMEEVVK